MTVEEVEAVIHLQVNEHPTATNAHQLVLKDALVRPRRISVIEKTVKDGQVFDQELRVWLIADERPGDGYKIVMSDDGLRFWLASSGFSTDGHLVVSGWYNSLLAAFLGM
ncbi:MAG TPA: hypothetical protein VHE33_05095 [Acidobacteriaceae bacterium]|nr:hypothetical protein [Acidobacteriaceae bacterium]